LSGDRGRDDRQPSGQLLGGRALQSRRRGTELPRRQARGVRVRAVLLVDRDRPATRDRASERDYRRAYPGDPTAAQRKGLARPRRVDGNLRLAPDRHGLTGRLTRLYRSCTLAAILPAAARPAIEGAPIG